MRGRAELTPSGMARFTRGAFIFYGNTDYSSATTMPYDANRNVLHELGHVLFLPHQWMTQDATTGAVGGEKHVAGEHDFSDYCIMSYLKGTPNHFDFCGVCNLKLRGWDTSQIPMNTSWRAST